MAQAFADRVGGEVKKYSAFNETGYGTYLSSANQNYDSLKVDKMWYSLPLGDQVTFTAGPKIENYYMHGTTPSIYKPVLKQFTLGGNAAAYGASTSPGAGLTWTSDSGLALSTNFTTQKGNSTGLLTDEGLDAYGVNAMYTGDTYGISLSYATTEATTTSDDNYTALNAYWAPEGFPSVSIGYEWGTDGSEVAAQDGLTSYFVGLMFEDVGPGTLAVSYTHLTLPTTLVV